MKMKHIGLIFPDRTREIILECNLLSRAGRKPYQDPLSVHWVETAGRKAGDVTADVQRLYDEMAGPFACRKVSLDWLTQKIRNASCGISVRL